MKTNTIEQHRNTFPLASIPSRLLLVLFPLIYIGCIPQRVSHAQESKRYEVKAARGTMECIENSKTRRKIFSNTRWCKTELLKEYEADFMVEKGFPGFYMDIHDPFVQAFRNTFSVERLALLSSRNESFKVHFDVDQDGKHLGMWFTLGLDTQVTPDELLLLEENLKELIVFRPIRKSEHRFFSEIYIRTTFKEIYEGNIPFIHKSKRVMEETAEIEKLKEAE
jgi:hypothetical protein